MVARTTLDPKQDVVFKLLFARPSNKRLLIGLLTAILEPALPIADVEVLNPEVTKESVEEKGTVLDILVKLSDGRQVNLEMQASAQGWRMSRGVFYCARVFASELSRGDDYEELSPVVGIFILDFRALSGERYHSKFELLEVHDHVRLTDDLTIHVVELAKLPKEGPAEDSPAVLKWSRFLAAKSDEELEQVAMSDPHLREAKTALEELSQDPAARRLVEERQLSAMNYRHTIAQARREALRDAVEHVCQTLGVEVTVARRATLDAATPEGMQAILDHVVLHRNWPD